MNASDVLTTITLAVSGWTLLKVMRLGEDLAGMRERLRNLDNRTP